MCGGRQALQEALKWLKKGDILPRRTSCFLGTNPNFRLLRHRTPLFQEVALDNPAHVHDYIRCWGITREIEATAAVLRELG